MQRGLKIICCIIFPLINELMLRLGNCCGFDITYLKYLHSLTQFNPLYCFKVIFKAQKASFYPSSTLKEATDQSNPDPRKARRSCGCYAESGFPGDAQVDTCAARTSKNVFQLFVDLTLLFKRRCLSVLRRSVKCRISALNSELLLTLLRGSRTESSVLFSSAASTSVGRGHRSFRATGGSRSAVTAVPPSRRAGDSRRSLKWRWETLDRDVSVFRVVCTAEYSVFRLHKVRNIESVYWCWFWMLCATVDSPIHYKPRICSGSVMTFSFFFFLFFLTALRTPWKYIVFNNREFLIKLK